MNMEEFITGVSHDRKESFGYGTCSNYLACSIESQAVGFRIQVSVMKSFYRKAVGLRLQNIDVGNGVLFQIGRWLQDIGKNQKWRTFQANIQIGENC